MKRLRKTQKWRQGMTLVELLGVMVVLAILATLAIAGVLKSVERSNVTKCLSAIDGYRSAFLDAAVSHPSIFGDRIQAWGDNGSTYSSEFGLQRAANYMNDVLDDDMHFYWDRENKYYKTTQVDPWGGYYILTEHPQPVASADPADPPAADPAIPADPGTPVDPATPVDPTTPPTTPAALVAPPDPSTNPDYYSCDDGKLGETYFTCSIWATGNNDNLTTPGQTPTIADDSYGVCLVFAGGVVTPTFNGFNNTSPFEGWTIQYK